MYDSSGRFVPFRNKPAWFRFLFIAFWAVAVVGIAGFAASVFLEAFGWRVGNLPIQMGVASSTALGCLVILITIDKNK